MHFLHNPLRPAIHGRSREMLTKIPHCQLFSANPGELARTVSSRTSRSPNIPDTRKHNRQAGSACAKDKHTHLRRPILPSPHPLRCGEDEQIAWRVWAVSDSPYGL
jgi:hypothetical protein